MHRPVVTAALFVGCASPGQVERPDATVSSAPPPACAANVVALGMSPGMTLDIFVRAAGVTDAEYVELDDRPVLQNQREVERVLRDSYAPSLRDAGMQGTTVFMVMVDTVGAVTHRIVAESSGHAEIDDGGAAVIDAMRFSPALVGGCRARFVAQIPIRMQVTRRE